MMDKLGIEDIVKEYLKQNLRIYMYTGNGAYGGGTTIHVDITLDGDEIASNYVTIKEGEW